MLYKVTKPANLALLMENTLCGRNPVTYIAVRPFAGCGRSLNVYYGSKQPSGVNSSGLCGTFNYEARRSEEHTSELQSLIRISYAVFCLKKKNKYLQSSNTISQPH